MRIQNRLRRLEQRASAVRAAGDTEGVEIWIPYDGRNGDPPGRCPIEGTQNAVIIYDPDEQRPPIGEAPS
jgi:hypothetical protein